MNKTQQLLKSREEEFDKEFPSTYREFPSGKDFIEVVSVTYPMDAIKSFHATTISLLLTSLKEEVQKMKVITPDQKPEFTDEEMIAYNQALSDISTLLSETISNLTKSNE